MSQTVAWKTFESDAGATNLSDNLNAALAGGWEIVAVTLNTTANAYVILLRQTT